MEMAYKISQLEFYYPLFIGAGIHSSSAPASIQHPARTRTRSIMYPVALGQYQASELGAHELTRLRLCLTEFMTFSTPTVHVFAVLEKRGRACVQNEEIANSFRDLLELEQYFVQRET